MSPTQNWWMKGIKEALLQVKIRTLTRDIRHVEREMDRLIWRRRQAEEALQRLTQVIE